MAAPETLEALLRDELRHSLRRLTPEPLVAEQLAGNGATPAEAGRPGRTVPPPRLRQKARGGITITATA